MASLPKRKDIAHQRNGGRMTADYGHRAALALDHCIPGPNRDKTVARLFGVSVRMAQYLRRGQFWTVERLSQASAGIGTAFDTALYSPVSSGQHYSEMADIAERLARLEAQVAGMDRGGDEGLAPPEGETARDEGGQVAEPVRALGRGVA